MGYGIAQLWKVVSGKITQMVTGTPVYVDGATEIANSLDMSASNLFFVPIGVSIQTCVNAAIAGDVLILGAGTYTLSAAITIPIGIKLLGAGVSKTTITYSSVTATDYVIWATADNVTIEGMSIIGTTTGTSAFYGIMFDATATTVFSNCKVKDVNVSLSGKAISSGVKYTDAGGTMRNVVVNSLTTGTNKTAVGVFFQNNSTADAPTTLVCYNVQASATGTGSGGAYGIYNQDNVSSQDSFLYLYDCYASAASTAIYNQGLYTVGGDAYVYAYDSIFKGSTFDALASASSATFQLSNCVLINGTMSGTITFLGTTVNSALFVNGHLILTQTDGNEYITGHDADGWVNIHATTGVEINAQTLNVIDLYASGQIYQDDNDKHYWGTGDDADIYYDGTDLYINPKVVGTGDLKVLGSVYPTGYKSSDGSAGITATIVTAPITGGGAQGSMTFKDGLLTAQTPAT